jgi:hypothetical protein
MHVQGSFITTKEFSVNPADVFLALRREVMRAKGFRANAYIDDKKRLVVDEDEWGSHHWTKTVILDENPSEEIVNLINAFELIRREIQE